MSGFAEYERYDAIGLAALVRAGDVEPGDLLEEAIRRRDARNPKINALVHDMDEVAYRFIEAELPADGVFRGVPFLLKDLLAAYAGVPMTDGSRFKKDFVPDYDSEMVRRFKAAGLVVFGKTNCPENGIVGVTEPHLHGATLNPWDLERSAGGSSGGSGAAVAARIVPMASGGDGGGSIRIPASCCALVGLKPSRGRNPYGPAVGEPWFGQVQEGVLSLSVRDTAAALDVTSGLEVGGPYGAPPPERPFLEEVTRAPGAMRIAWTAEPLMRDGELSSECVSALRATVEQLTSLGHACVEVAPPFDKSRLGRGHILRMMCAAAADLREARESCDRDLRPDDFEPETWALARLGEALSAPRIEGVARELHEERRKFEVFMKDYDVFLTPTLSKPAVPLGEFTVGGIERVGAMISRHVGWGPFGEALVDQFLPGLIEKNFDWVSAPPAFNITGSPSLSLPLQWSAEGLPIGMMFSASYLDEASLFRLAGQLEREVAWGERLPPLLGAAA